MERTRLHQLGDILTIAILSVLAGGNGWEDMEYRFSKVTRDLIRIQNSKFKIQNLIRTMCLEINPNN